MQIDKESIYKKESISVGYFFEKIREIINVKLLTPDKSGFDNLIYEQNLHRPGLALAGFVDLFTHDRVQLIGNTEYKYCRTLSDEQLKQSLERLFKFNIPCIVLTNNNQPHQILIDLATKHEVPVFQISQTTTKAAYIISDFLEDQFATRVSIHGSFVDVHGVGILFVGKAGIGKSEISLDLVERGHRLVADDVVVFTKKGESVLIGSGTDVIQHSMEIRGIGIIDVEKMFGIHAIRFQKRLEVVVELEVWNPEEEYTRTGLDEEKIKILDIPIHYIKLPILPGKNITVIAETIALNYLLKHYGYDAAKELNERLKKKIQEGKSRGERFINYFEHDFE